jgi:hypothetical protein
MLRRLKRAAQHLGIWQDDPQPSIARRLGSTSGFGTFRTWRDVRSLVAVGGKPDIANVVQQQCFARGGRSTFAPS